MDTTTATTEQQKTISIYEKHPTKDILESLYKEDHNVNRNKQLVDLARLLLADGSFVVAIDGKWGAGKTFFVKELQSLLEHPGKVNLKIHQHYNGEVEEDSFLNLSRSCVFLYYDAWKNDIHNDPLESLLFYLTNEYGRTRPSKEAIRKMMERAKKFIKNYLRIKSGGLFNLDEKDATLFNGAELAEARIKTFQNIVHDIIGDKQLILVIDELDRCRPDFAIRTLEVVKHFFDDDRIKVVLATNLRELAYVVNHYYGEKFDGFSYLHRIIDFTMELSPLNALDYFEYAAPSFANDRAIYRRISIELARTYDFTPRDCNRFLQLYDFCHKFLVSRSSDFLGSKRTECLIQKCLFLPLTIFLKLRNIKEYDDFVAGRGAYILERICDEIHIDADEFKWVIDGEQRSNRQAILDAYAILFDRNNIIDLFPLWEALESINL